MNVFQFHKGAIRTAYSEGLQRTKLRFNSIKVRLEQANDYYGRVHIMFQFHKGAIRTSPSSVLHATEKVSIP